MISPFDTTFFKKMAASRHHVSCGLDLHCVPDISNCLSFASNSGYQFITAPIVHPRFQREFILGKSKNRSGAFTRSDLLLTSQDWSSLIVGKLSTWLNLDSPITHIRKNSEQALQQELSYAAHLSLPAILVSLKSEDCINLARCIYSHILASESYQVWVEVPMQAAEDLSEVYINKPESAEAGTVAKQTDTWDWWNTFRGVCNTDKKFGLALELSADIPSEDIINRWMGEPIRCITVPTSLFLTNKKGYPVLSRAHQQVFEGVFKLGVQVLIKGVNRHESIRYYQQYMDHLWMSRPNDDTLAQFARGYEDYLQVPLQPLMDNLESCTYEIFEKDPVKYTEYQRAMYEAILDKVPSTEKDSRVLVLMVVGAGRGPLVRAALAAAKNAERDIKVFAVEKNPNAVVTLQNLQDEMWGSKVTVVSSDMRDWNPPEKADILVSELLGSFGDNELSPECLDGAQKFLKDDGISIPESYTSYLAPLQSPKLYSEVVQMKDREKPYITCFEMPYVVRLHNRTELASPQPLFSFHHPNRDEVINNTRYKNLTFHIENNYVLHGFAGYFDTVLYKNIKLSIVPESHSPGMFSWFPIFFPLKEPIQLKGGCQLQVHFWRCANRKNVWYEWCVTKPVIGPIHNPNGRSYTIGL
ncbi:protein arginine N-methyltransferase 5 isoform X2 [Tachypleus tridentatus]|uniref:protein arginine N-methyltransferase 5 isoform X2 n=1 Tax=Tachypleus tridentatus TaxID=6853 RepID=UPI003FD4E005